MLHFLIGLGILALILSIPAGRVLVGLVVLVGIVGFILLIANSHQPAPSPTPPSAPMVYRPPPPPPKGGERFTNRRPLPELPAGAKPLTPRDMPCDPNDHTASYTSEGKAEELVVYRNWLAPEARAQWVTTLPQWDRDALWRYIRAFAYVLDDKWYVPARDGTTGAPTPGWHRLISPLPAEVYQHPGYAAYVAGQSFAGNEWNKYYRSLPLQTQKDLANFIHAYVKEVVPAGPF